MAASSQGEGSATGTATSQADGSASGEGNCAPYVLDVAEDCEGIGSAQSYLDEAAEHVEELEWIASQSADITHTPNTGTTSLTLRVSYAGGEVRCTPYCSPCPPEEMCPGVGSASLEVDALVEVSTEDGALADTWPTILAGGPDANTNFRTSVSTADVQGSLVVESPTGEWPSLGIELAGGFAGGASTGHASVRAEKADGTATSFNLARWPPQ